ncbi:glycosyltransferase [soil metagenome]
MIDNHTLSAVIFVYNEEKYISQQLDSILNQTVKIDKIIMVDDFSTDNTKNIIIKYQKENPQIKYYLSKKKGKIYAYQTGIKLVDTDLFFVCAGDDVLMNTFVEKLYSLVTKERILYAYANYVYADENLNPQYSLPKKTFYSCSELIFENYVSGYLFGYSSIITHLTPLPDELIFEDWFTSIKLSYIYGKNFIHVEPLFYYRRHKAASTATILTKAKLYFHLDRDIKLYSVILQESYITNTEIKNIIESRLFFYQTMRHYSLLKGIKLFLIKHLTLRERIKGLLFPFFVRYKYK